MGAREEPGVGAEPYEGTRSTRREGRTGCIPVNARSTNAAVVTMRLPAGRPKQMGLWL